MRFVVESVGVGMGGQTTPEPRTDDSDERGGFPNQRRFDVFHINSPIYRQKFYLKLYKTSILFTSGG